MRTPITLNDNVILRKRKDAYGHSSEKTVISERNVRGHAYMPSLSFQASNLAAGKKVDMEVNLLRHDFEADNWNYAEIKGTEYRISGVGSGTNDLYVNLILARKENV